MPKKLLCTLSEDPHMFNGLRFLCHFFRHKEDMDLTLLGLAAPDSPYCLWRSGNRDGDRPLETDRNWQTARDEAVSMLVREGFTPEQIRVKSSGNMLCRIEDIEQEIGQDNYDAVVMGRRGLGRLKDFFQKSLSRRLLELSPDAPLMLCRKPDVNRENVLLCVDGSGSSMRMTGFVADMLHKESHLVTLCNVIRDTDDDRKKSTEIFERCEALMAEKGFGSDRLRYMIYPSDYAPRAVLDNAHWGKFAMVAVGASTGKSFLAGSVSNYLFNELSGAVLWIHP